MQKSPPTPSATSWSSRPWLCTGETTPGVESDTGTHPALRALGQAELTIYIVEDSEAVKERRSVGSQGGSRIACMRAATLLLLFTCACDGGGVADAGPDAGPSCTVLDWDPGSGELTRWPEPALLADENCHVHHYSKTEVREGRKLGHATWAGASPA